MSVILGAKQTWETAMDDEVANAGKTSRANFPWLAAYPAGVPARIETPPYNVLGEIAADLAARRPAARAFTTIMPNGMAANLTFAEVDRHSDAFAAYLRETLRLEPGARVAIQSPNGLAYPVQTFEPVESACVGRSQHSRGGQCQGLHERLGAIRHRLSAIYRRHHGREQG